MNDIPPVQVIEPLEYERDQNHPHWMRLVLILGWMLTANGLSSIVSGAYFAFIYASRTFPTSAPVSWFSGTNGVILMSYLPMILSGMLFLSAGIVLLARVRSRIRIAQIIMLAVCGVSLFRPVLSTILGLSSISNDPLFVVSLFLQIIGGIVFPLAIWFILRLPPLARAAGQ